MKGEGGIEEAVCDDSGGRAGVGILDGVDNSGCAFGLKVSKEGLWLRESNCIAVHSDGLREGVWAGDDLN